MGIYDQERAASFYETRLIRSARWIVDPSLFSRRPDLAGSLIRRFGADSFRAVNTHAKFLTVRSDTLAVCVRSSMNLNPNKRLENFDVSEDPALTAWFEAFVSDVFGRYTADNRSQSNKYFAGVLEAFEEIEARAKAAAAVSSDPLGELALAESMADGLRCIVWD